MLHVRISLKALQREGNRGNVFMLLKQTQMLKILPIKQHIEAVLLGGHGKTLLVASNGSIAQESHQKDSMRLTSMCIEHG